MKKLFLIWISIFFIISLSSSVFSEAKIDFFYVTSNTNDLEISDSGNYYGLLHNEGSLLFRANITVSGNQLGWEISGDNLRINQPNLLDNYVYFDSCYLADNCTIDSCDHKFRTFFCSKNIPVSNIDMSKIHDFNEFTLQLECNSGTIQGLPSSDSILCHNAFNTPINVEFEFDMDDDSIVVDFDIGDIEPKGSCPMPSIERVNAIINGGEYNESVANIDNDIEFDNVELAEGEHEIYLELYFNSEFMQETSSQTFEFDNEKPRLLDIKLKDENDNLIEDRFVYDEENNRFTNAYLEFIVKDMNFRRIELDLNELTNDQRFHELNLYQNSEECENIGGYNYSCRTDKTGLNNFKLTSDNFKVYYSICDSQGLCNDGNKLYELDIDNDGAGLSSWSSFTDLDYDFDFEKEDYEKISNSLLTYIESDSFFNSKLTISNCIDKECFFREDSSINYTLIFNDDNFKKEDTSFDLSEIDESNDHAPDYFYQDEGSFQTILGVLLEIGSNQDDFQLYFSGEDSLGNQFSAFESGEEVQFNKDNFLPIIDNISVDRVMSGEHPRESIATSDHVIVNITVNDSKSPFLGYIIDFKNLTFSQEIRTGECKNITDDVFNCLIESNSPVVGGPTTEEIDIYVFDLAGNTIKESYDVEVLGTMDEEVPEVTLIPDNFVPDFIDRQLVSLFNYPIRGEILLDSDRGLFIDSQHFTGCNIDNIGYQVNSYDVFSSSGDMESLFTLDLPIMNDDDLNKIEKLNFTCGVNTYVRTEDFIYTAPNRQDMSFSIEVLNTPFKLPSQEIYHEVKNNLDGFSQHTSFLHTVRNVLSVGENACNLMQGLSSADHALSIGGSTLKGVELIVRGFDDVFVPLKAVSNILSSVTNVLDQIHTTITDLFGNLLFDYDFLDQEGEVGIVGKMCSYITCHQCNPIDSTMFITDFYSGLPGIDDHHVLGQEIFGEVNPQDSLVLSLGCGCLGSIVFKLSDYRQMQCERDLCLLRRSSLGESTIPCRQSYVEQKCNFIIGEAYVLMPWGIGLDMWANEITSLLTLDEKIIQNAVGGLLCPEDGGEGTLGFLDSEFDLGLGSLGTVNELRDWVCRIPRGIYRIQKGLEMIDEGSWLGGFGGFFDDGFDWGEFVGIEQDPCEELKEVFDELDN